MSDIIMQIPVEDLLMSLKDGYTELKTAIENDESAEHNAHIKGFCTTVEKMLAIYGSVSSEEMMKIKRPILGEMSLRYKGTTKNNLDEPTIFRQGKMKKIEC